MNELALLKYQWLEERRKLAEQYGLEQDDPALFDSLDGALDLADRLRILVRKRREILANCEALKAMRKEMDERLARLEKTADAIKDSVIFLMQDTGMKRLPAPDFSVSLSYGKPPLSGAEALDPDALPERFVRTKKEVNRTALREALEAGEKLEGVSIYLGNPQPILTVRRT